MGIVFAIVIFILYLFGSGLMLYWAARINGIESDKAKASWFIAIVLVVVGYFVVFLNSFIGPIGIILSLLVAFITPYIIKQVFDLSWGRAILVWLTWIGLSIVVYLVISLLFVLFFWLLSLFSTSNVDFVSQNITRSMPKEIDTLPERLTDFSLCDESPSGIDRDWCQYYSVTAELDDVEVCEAIEDQGIRRLCCAHINTFSGFSACNETDSEWFVSSNFTMMSECEDERCEYGRFNKIDPYLMDHRMIACSEVDDMNLRSACVIRLNKLVFFEHINLCSEVTDSLWRDNCYMEGALGKKDQSYCDLIENSNKKKTCKEPFLIADQDYETYCAEKSYETAKDECISKVAALLGDAEICNSIETSFNSKRCHDGVY